MTAKVPTSDTGTATMGMIEARQVCRKMRTTSTTSARASNKRAHDLFDGGAYELRRVVGDLRTATPSGKDFDSSSHRSSARLIRQGSRAFEPGDWKMGMATAFLLLSKAAQRIGDRRRARHVPHRSSGPCRHSGIALMMTSPNSRLV